MSDQAIEWGVLVRLPNGVDDVEVFSSRGVARCAASNINRKVDGAAKLVYRTVEYGPWTTGAGGDEWGVQSIWADGHAEVARFPSRELAEANARSALATSTRLVASRTKQVSDWWLAEVPA